MVISARSHLVNAFCDRLLRDTRELLDTKVTAAYAG